MHVIKVRVCASTAMLTVCQNLRSEQSTEFRLPVVFQALSLCLPNFIRLGKICLEILNPKHGFPRTGAIHMLC